MTPSPRMAAFKVRLARLARYRTRRNADIVKLQAGHPAAEIGRHYQITSERVRQIGKAPTMTRASICVDVALMQFRQLP